MFRFAVCDDEKHYLQKIVQMLEILLNKQGVAFQIDTYSSGVELCRDMEKINEYDGIFLDMKMDLMDGVDAARLINKHNKDVLLIFITAFIDYTLKGSPTRPFRTLLKDQLEKTFPECVKAMLLDINARVQTVTYDFQEGRKELRVGQICYVESMKHKLTFHRSRANLVPYHMYEALNKIEADLKDYGFLRIHRSYLVNVMCIRDLHKYEVEVETGETLPIPRDKYKSVQERYFEMIGDL